MPVYADASTSQLRSVPTRGRAHSHADASIWKGLLLSGKRTCSEYRYFLLE